MRFRLLALLGGMIVVVGLSLAACESGERALHVSPLPPTVTSRTPDPGDDNVSVREPFLVTFSEAIDSSTVTDSSVILTGAGSALLGKTLDLSLDARTLTIDMIGNPDLPNTLMVTLTGAIKDLTGDSLILPSDDWSFTVPDWLEVGAGLSAVEGATTHSYSPSLAVDVTGYPTVAWHETAGGVYDIYVKRWNGTMWTQLGGPLSATSGASAFHPSLALDGSGNPTVAWQENDGVTADNIYVQQWNGTSWTQLGEGLSAVTGGTSAIEPTLALDDTGNPTVAWYEFDGSTAYNVYVQQWNGTSWTQLGEGLSGASGTSSMNPALAVDAAGNPTVAWHEYDGTAVTNIYVASWNGAAWTQFGEPRSAISGGTNAMNPTLALDDAGHPTVAWYEYDGDRAAIYVQKWNGSEWTQLGGAPSGNNGSAVYPTLALDEAGNPIVGWQNYDSTTFFNIHVARWDGMSWDRLGGALSANPANTPAYKPSLALDDHGFPLVAWEDRESTAVEIHVRRYNQ